MAHARRPPLALPLALRDRLTRLILEALHDAGARRALRTLADPREPVPPEWVRPEDREHADALRERAARAACALATRPVERARVSLPEALADSAALFDAGLYFEVHELLEPYWTASRGVDRGTLQGLIQIAVGYQHLANGNLRGARALLDGGSAKIRSRRIGGRDLTRFARAVRGTIERVDRFDWALVPSFPREG